MGWQTVWQRARLPLNGRLLPPQPEIPGGPSGDRPFVGACHELVGFRPDQIDVRVLFHSDRFAAALIGFEPGQSVPPHSHEHKDEVFDVVSGEGEILVDGTWHPAPAGSTFYLPVGNVHALRNTSGERWVVRETIRERIYARSAVMLVVQAVAKRLRSRLPGLGSGDQQRH